MNRATQNPKQLADRAGDATAADEAALGHLIVTAGVIAKTSSYDPSWLSDSSSVVSNGSMSFTNGCAGSATVTR